MMFFNLESLSNKRNNIIHKKHNQVLITTLPFLSITAWLVTLSRPHDMVSRPNNSTWRQEHGQNLSGIKWTGRCNCLARHIPSQVKSGKKRDIQANTEAAIEKDFQITDYFISRCGINALKKLNSIIAPRKVEDLPFAEIQTTFLAYLKPTERLVVAERTMFLSTEQGSNENEADFLARLREAARYSKFDDLKNSNGPEAELIRLRFIAGLRNREAKLKLREQLRGNEALACQDLLQTLQYRSQPEKFVSSHDNPDKDTIAFSTKQRFSSRKPPRTWENNNRECGRCGSEWHTFQNCPAKDKWCDSCGMKGHVSKKCRNKARETQDRKEYSQRGSKGSHHISEGRKDDKQDSDSDGLYSITETPESLPGECTLQYHLGLCEHPQQANSNATRYWLQHHHHIISHLAYSWETNAQT